MKIRSLLSAALVCGCLTFTWTTAAQTNGNVAHTEIFNAKYALTATPDAPTGAKGTALLKSENHDGTQSINLLLRTHGLDPGDYAVTAVQTSDGTEVPIGDITVPESSRGHHKTDTKDNMDVVADVVGSDIGEIIVSDSNGVAMLQGDLGARGSSGNLRATVPVTGGEVAPSATGVAKLKVTIQNGHRKDNFTMKASDVPANSTFTVNVDGTEAGTVKSTRAGRVTVKKIPQGLGSISAVVLSDEGGGEVVRADF